MKAVTTLGVRHFVVNVTPPCCPAAEPPNAAVTRATACLAGLPSHQRRRVEVVLVSLAAALVAALCYGIAAVMQAMAVRAASRRTATTSRSRLGTVDPGLVVRMLHQWPFIASLGLDLIGFFAQ